MLSKVVSILYLAALIVGLLGGSVMKVYIAGALDKKGLLQILY